MLIRRIYFNQLQNMAHHSPRKALKMVCQEFEALMWQEVLKGMENTIPRSGLFPDGLESRIYRDLFYQELAREVAGRQTGIADLLYRELSRKLPQGRLMPPPKNAEKGGRDG